MILKLWNSQFQEEGWLFIDNVTSVSVEDVGNYCFCHYPHKHEEKGYGIFGVQREAKIYPNETVNEINKDFELVYTQDILKKGGLLFSPESILRKLKKDEGKIVKIIMVHFSDDSIGTYISLTNDSGYLLSENGKTIERI